MKVKDLVEILKKSDENDEVVIYSPSQKPLLQGERFVEIVMVCEGFKWNEGKVFLYPKKGR